jgi:hypothetical protein
MIEHEWRSGRGDFCSACSDGPTLVVDLAGLPDTSLSKIFIDAHPDDEGV